MLDWTFGIGLDFFALSWIFWISLEFLDWLGIFGLDFWIFWIGMNFFDWLGFFWIELDFWDWGFFGLSRDFCLGLFFGD